MTTAAPQADEAFKAVGLAYATLSDGQKRTIYNQSGEEDPDRNPGGMAGFRRGGGGGGMHGQRMDPEDIFNMFFQGGMGGGGRGPGGVHFYSNGFGPGMQFPGGGPRRRPRAAPGGGPAEQPEPSPMGNLFQFLPIIVMMLLSFLRYSGDETRGPMPGEQRYFSLTVRGEGSKEIFVRCGRCAVSVRVLAHYCL
jgi:DnaJ family protein B protein 12